MRRPNQYMVTKDNRRVLEFVDEPGAHTSTAYPASDKPVQVPSGPFGLHVLNPLEEKNLRPLVAKSKTVTAFIAALRSKGYVVETIESYRRRIQAR